MSVASVDFASDSAMMIAWERALETERTESPQPPLFSDPYARRLAGEKGEGLSEQFEAYAPVFGFTDWPVFHKTWTVVRTKFIDDRLQDCFAAPSPPRQFVNLGAGLDTRVYRLECLKGVEKAFEVDLDKVLTPKTKLFEHWGAEPICTLSATVAADLLDAGGLKSCLEAAGFGPAAPSVLLAEGLIMYLGERGADFLTAVSGIAAAGSTFILNYMEGKQGEGGEPQPGTWSPDSLRAHLEPAGWRDFQFFVFGDDSLNFGRFPADQEPNRAFSFMVCTKGTSE